MGRKGTERGGDIRLHAAVPFDPAAKHHDKDGTPIIRSRAEGEDYAKALSDRTGRTFRWNPDGGIPHGDELVRLRQREREEARRRGR